MKKRIEAVSAGKEAYQLLSKRTYGRKPLPPEQARTIAFTFYVTPGEAAILDREIKKIGTDRAEWLRRLAIGAIFNPENKQEAKNV